MNYKSKSSIIEINQSWHIPRASLASGSSSNNSSVSHSANGSQLSHSTVSSLKHGKRRPTTDTTAHRSQRKGSDGQRNRAYLSDDEHVGDGDRRPRHPAAGRRGRRSNSSDSQWRTANGIIEPHPNGLQAAADFVVSSAGGLGGVKRSSQSSQGSTDSNHSSHSASSGSMLLTAANLEQLAQIHKRNELNATGHSAGAMLQANVDRLTSTYSANITAVAEASPSHIVTINGGANNVGGRPKDVDTLSLASSTHFTMVNGVGGPQRKHKSGLCDRGHQITVLILTMSAIFLIGICGAVFMLEMRAKKMMDNSMRMTFSPGE